MAVPAGTLPSSSTEKAFIGYLSTRLDGTLVAPENELLNAFNQSYGVLITLPQLKDALKSIKSPQDRVTLLRPVLRQMLRNQPVVGADGIGRVTVYPPTGLNVPLADNELEKIAKVFTVEADLKRLQVENAPKPGFNPLNAIGSVIQDQDNILNDTDFLKLKERVSTAVFSTSVGTSINLKPALSQFESDKRAKSAQTPAGPFGMIQKMMEKLPALINPFGIGGANGPLAFIGQMLAQLFNMLMPMFSGLAEITKSATQANKAEDAPLDEKDINQDPETAKEAAEFAELSNQLATLGSSKGKIAAAELNKEWRMNPNAPEVWKKLMTAMTSNGLLEKADEWLSTKEDELLSDLNNIVAEENRRVAAHEAPILTALQITHLKNALKAYRDDALNKGLKNPVLTYASEKDKKAIFAVRHDIYQKCSKDMHEIKAKYDEALKDDQLVKDKTKQLGVATAQHTTAAGLGAGAAVLTQDLQLRMNALTAEITALNKEIGDDKALITTAETHLQNNALPEAQGLFTAYYNRDLRRATGEATRAKAAEDARKAAEDARRVSAVRGRARGGRGRGH